MEQEKTMELLQNMRELKANIEYEQNNDITSKNKEKIQIVIQDIVFYGEIKIFNPTTKQEENKNIYRVEKNVGNKQCIEFYSDNEIIATIIDNENQIKISPKYARNN